MTKAELKSSLHTAIAVFGARQVMAELSGVCKEIADQSAVAPPAVKSYLAELAVRLRDLAHDEQVV